MWDWVRSRRLVGEDENHLFYSEFVEKGKPERRYVEFKDNNILHSSDRMPIEWWSWLHNRRENVPTEEEIATSVRARESLAKRVAELEEEDERQRIRQMMAASHASNPTDDTTSSTSLGVAELNHATVTAARDELAARRRRKALERLQDASTPTESYPGKRNVSYPDTPPGDNKQSVRFRERNERSDPKVSICIPANVVNSEFCAQAI